MVALYSRRGVGAVGLCWGPKWQSTCDVRGPLQNPLKKAFSLYIFYLIYLLLLQATSDRGRIRRHFFLASTMLRSYMAYNVCKINLRP